MLTVPEFRTALAVAVRALDPNDDLVMRAVATYEWRKTVGPPTERVMKAMADWLLIRAYWHDGPDDATGWDLWPTAPTQDFLEGLALAFEQYADRSHLESTLHKFTVKDQAGADAVLRHAMRCYWTRWSLGLSWDPW